MRQASTHSPQQRHRRGMPGIAFGISHRKLYEDTVLAAAATLVAAAFCVALIVAATLTMAGCSKAPAEASLSQPATQAADAAPPADGNNAGNNSSQGQENSLKAQKPSPQVSDPISIPAGTAITVRLQSPVSSASNHAGDHFQAVLAANLTVHGRTLARAGAPVNGRVLAATASGGLHHPGMIQLTLSSIEINGKALPVATSALAAQGASHKKRNVAMIGGGAGGGALLGGLLGGGKGALIGGLVGAGAGTGTAYATGKKNVGFGVDQSLTFRLSRPVKLS